MTDTIDTITIMHDGRAAFTAGQSFLSNPHREHTPEWRTWRAGWDSEASVSAVIGRWGKPLHTQRARHHETICAALRLVQQHGNRTKIFRERRQAEHLIADLTVLADLFQAEPATPNSGAVPGGSGPSASRNTEQRTGEAAATPLRSVAGTGG